MTFIEINRAKQERKEQQREAPPQYVIVLHATPAVLHRTIARVFAEHALTEHLSVRHAEAQILLSEAGNKGRAVVKTVTRDVGDTLISELLECPSTTNDDFRFTLETA